MWTSLKMLLQEMNLGLSSKILILRSKFWNGKALERKATEKESQVVKIKIKAILIALTLVQDRVTQGQTVISVYYFGVMKSLCPCEREFAEECAGLWQN